MHRTNYPAHRTDFIRTDATRAAVCHESDPDVSVKPFDLSHSPHLCTNHINSLTGFRRTDWITGCI